MIQCQYVIDIYIFKTVSFIFTLIIRHRTSIYIYTDIAANYLKGRTKIGVDGTSLERIILL